MTHRVYLRLPQQTTIMRTSTDDVAVAELAFRRIVEAVDTDADLLNRAVGIAWTQNGKQRLYCQLPDDLDNALASLENLRSRYK